MIFHTESLHGSGKFNLAMCSELVFLVACQMGECGNQNFALLATSAGNEGYLSVCGGIEGHGGTVIDALIIGMGMDQKKSFS